MATATPPISDAAGEAWAPNRSLPYARLLVYLFVCYHAGFWVKLYGYSDDAKWVQYLPHIRMRPSHTTSFLLSLLLFVPNSDASIC